MDLIYSKNGICQWSKRIIKYATTLKFVVAAFEHHAQPRKFSILYIASFHSYIKSLYLFLSFDSPHLYTLSFSRLLPSYGMRDVEGIYDISYGEELTLAFEMPTWLLRARYISTSALFFAKIGRTVLQQHWDTYRLSSLVNSLSS